MVNYMYSSDDDVDNSPAFETMLEFAKVQLLKRPANETALKANVEFDEASSSFRLESLGQKIAIETPSCRAVLVEEEKPPHWAWHLIMLHYLSEADGTPKSEELMTFRTQQGGFIRGAGFDKDSAKIIAEQFARKPINNIRLACEALGALIVDSNADICAVFTFLPNYPVTLQIWFADDEMDGSGQLLLNANAAHYLSVEDAITAGSMILKFLTKQYELLFPE